MDNPFLGGPKHLGYRWRDLRSHLTAEKSDLEHLNMVVDFWSKAPIVNPFLNWDDTKTWSDPWELISEMTFDISCLAIGMEYTLLLSEDQRWTPDRLRPSLVHLLDRSHQYMVLVVDGKHVLNHSYNRIVSLDHGLKDFVITQRYAYINKAHTTV